MAQTTRPTEAGSSPPTAARPTRGDEDQDEGPDDFAEEIGRGVADGGSGAEDSSLAAASGVSFQCGRKWSQTRTAPANAGELGPDERKTIRRRFASDDHVGQGADRIQGPRAAERL